MENVLKLEKLDNWILVFEFPEFLDETNVWEVFESINTELWDYVNKKVVFNFVNLWYLNSRSLGSLSEVSALLNDNGWKIYITNCKPEVSSILDLIWADYLLPIVPTKEEAIKLLLS